MFHQLPEFQHYQHDVSRYWSESGIYEKIVASENESKLPQFNFIDGPPFPNGNPHFGHLAIGCAKDSVLKHKHKMGYRCNNKMGYDTHGLPVESAVQKALNINTREELEACGLTEFNSKCKEHILSFTGNSEVKGSWEPIYESIGRFVDFKHIYKTMDPEFMETVWWCFKQIWNKNLVFKASKIMPYSYGCQTVLSNFEAGLDVRTIKTKSAYVWFKLKGFENRGIVAWTTTPWTLPSNVALCVNPDLEYVVCTDESGTEYVVGSTAVNILKKTIVPSSIKSLGKGSELVGLEYEPLFNFLGFNYHKIIADNYVTSPSITETKNNDADNDDGNGGDEKANCNEISGTAVVHIAPAFGEDDARVCLEKGIITIEQLADMCKVNNVGKFNSDFGDNFIADKLVFDCDDIIINFLKSTSTSGKLVRTQVVHHKYRFCYRTGTPLIFMPSESIFINVPKIKDRMIEHNNKINWVPETIGSGRFNNWLKDAKIWCVSRNRFFGTPIPIWTSDDGSEMFCIGSIAELMEHAVDKTIVVTDLHPEFINDIKLISPTTGNILTRITDVFDCWFESGAVPYGQIHYPFENKEIIDSCDDFLCDFIVEGLDQTRGWFYTLLVLSTAISDKAPFRNVICSGLIKDSEGRKFSKKLGNCVDPTTTISKFGPDVLRLYLLNSPIVHADELYFNEDALHDVYRRILPLISAVDFFLEHSHQFVESNNPLTKIHYLLPQKFRGSDERFNIMDNWIFTMGSNLRHYVIDNMEKFVLDKPIEACINFIDDMTNWYIKLSRDRLKKISGLHEALTSLSVLYTVIMDYILISSQFMPFLSEYLYQKLKHIDPDQFTSESIHLMKYQYVIKSYVNVDKNVANFKYIQTISKMIRTVRDRSTKHTSVKTPINKCTFYHADRNVVKSISELIDIVSGNLNVIDTECKLIDESMYKFVPQPNNKSIGKKFGKRGNIVKQFINELPQEILAQFHNGDIKSLVHVPVDSEQFVISVDDFDITVSLNIGSNNTNIKVCEDDGLVVLVDLTYNENIHDLAQVKFFISHVQTMRKQLGLRPWNKISLLSVVDETHILDDYSKRLFSDESHINLLKEKLLCGIDENITEYLELSKIELHTFEKFDGTSVEYYFAIYIMSCNVLPYDRKLSKYDQLIYGKHLFTFMRKVGDEFTLNNVMDEELGIYCRVRGIHGWKRLLRQLESKKTEDEIVYYTFPDEYNYIYATYQPVQMYKQYGFTHYAKVNITESSRFYTVKGGLYPEIECTNFTIRSSDIIEIP